MKRLRSRPIASPATARLFRQGQQAMKKVTRPAAEVLTQVPGNIRRLALRPGCFNAGLAKLRDGRFACVYRPTEHAFTACWLTPDFKVAGQGKPLGIGNCADPRLLPLPDGRLLMVYSSCDEGRMHMECIRGAILQDGRHHADFITPVSPFRISPEGQGRQKNWMPFVHEGRIYLIASVRPHIVYELSALGTPAVQRYETSWVHPWFSDEFMRGNTNPVQLADGNYLGTFHTVQKAGPMHYYDNGCYVFEGKPPFKVLKCSRRTFLAAEHATERHYRKAGLIKVCFPVGMVREQESLTISYGDNDSAVKILTTTVQDMLNTTFDVY